MELAASCKKNVKSCHNLCKSKAAKLSRSNVGNAMIPFGRRRTSSSFSFNLFLDPIQTVGTLCVISLTFVDWPGSALLQISSVHDVKQVGRPPACDDTYFLGHKGKKSGHDFNYKEACCATVQTYLSL